VVTGFAALLAGGWISSQIVVNVVNYRVVRLASPDGDIRQFVPATPWLVTLMLAGILVTIAVRRNRTAPDGESGRVSVAGWAGVVRLAWPAWAMAAIVIWWWVAGGPGFVSMCAMAIATGCGITSLCLCGAPWGGDPSAASAVGGEGGRSRGGALIAIALTVAIGLATVWQVHLQYVYWRHFAMGFGDLGLFTQELEYCLPFKEVPERFADTRMGYHAVFMFYALAPLYALFRSPVFLMVVGPLALNVAAVPLWRWVKRSTGSGGIALVVAVSWLLLPSLSRMPFANQYGFQSVYLAVPFVAFALCLGQEGKWRGSHVCLALAVLCEETVCGVAVGWGIYLAFFDRERRATGMVIAAMSAGYLLLITQWIIPHFAAGSTYTRIDLFGELSATAVVERLLGRARSGLYLLALGAPLMPGLIRGWRLLVIIAPTLLLVLLLENPDYLNIKYWHQSTILPPLFIAGVVGALRLPRRPSAERTRCTPWAGALGLFTTVLLMHQFLGATPIAQSYRIHRANSQRLCKDDPRMAAVEYVRSRYARERTRVTATEMMAAHFCDYYEIRKLTWSADAPTDPKSDVLVLDHGDGRDSVVAAGAMDAFELQAAGAGYQLETSVAGVFVWVREQPVEDR